MKITVAWYDGENTIETVLLKAESYDFDDVWLRVKSSGGQRDYFRIPDVCHIRAEDEGGE